MASSMTKREYLRLIKEEGLTDLMSIYQEMAENDMSFWVWYRNVYQKKGWDSPKTVVRQLVSKELKKLPNIPMREAAERISGKFGFNVSRQLILTVKNGK